MIVILILDFLQLYNKYPELNCKKKSNITNIPTDCTIPTRNVLKFDDDFLDIK